MPFGTEELPLAIVGEASDLRVLLRSSNFFLRASVSSNALSIALKVAQQQRERH